MYLFSLSFRSWWLTECKFHWSKFLCLTCSLALIFWIIRIEESMHSIHSKREVIWIHMSLNAFIRRQFPVQRTWANSLKYSSRHIPFPPIPQNISDPNHDPEHSIFSRKWWRNIFFLCYALINNKQHRWWANGKHGEVVLTRLSDGLHRALYEAVSSKVLDVNWKGEGAENCLTHCSVFSEK